MFKPFIHFTLIPILILASSANAIRIGQKQTVEKTYDNNQPPSTIQLVCEKSQPSWRFNGQDAIGNPLFSINSKYLVNAQPTSGEYNGNYMCLDLSGNTAGTEYVVRINGTSNLSAGAIVGIVFAVLFAIIIIVVGLYLANKKGYLGGERDEYDEADKLQGHDVEVDDYDRNSHASRFRNAGQTSMIN